MKCIGKFSQPKNRSIGWGVNPLGHLHTVPMHNASDFGNISDEENAPWGASELASLAYDITHSWHMNQVERSHIVSITLQVLLEHVI